MTAPLPQGLLSVTSTPAHSPASQDPADLLFERHQILHNFWKVHEAKSRATRDSSDTRCRDLFWRVWGTPRLACHLSATTLTHLFLRCQQPIDLAPFDLDRESGGRRLTGQSIGWRESQSHKDHTTESASPTSSTSSSSPTSSGDKRLGQQSVNESSLQSVSTSSSKGHVRASSQSTASRPPTLSRTSSGGRKRTSFVAGGPRARTRPSVGRKKSSQTAVPTTHSTEPQRSPRSMKNSRRPSVEETIARTGDSSFASGSRNGPAIPPRSSTISAFELPSASSWQSVDSNIDHRALPSQAISSQESHPSLVEKNFRERFAEKVQSSSNLSSLNRMRKTGSVVRFADEVDLPEEFRKGKEKEQLSPHPEHDDSTGHARHRSSVSSIAAVSDDGSDDGIQLPRTKSQLSMMISDMKRKQSEGSQEMALPPNLKKTSTRDVSTRKEEEEKLLEMGRKDGVTRAGGVQMPHSQLLKKKGRLSIDESGYESPEGPLY